MTYLFRKYPIFWALIVLALVVAFAAWRSNASFSPPPKEKSTGGFYVGAYLPEESSLFHSDLEEALGTKFDIISLYEAWGPKSITQFPLKTLRAIREKNAVPLITWEPWTNTFTQFAKDPLLSKNKKVFQAILQGKFDAYIEEYATLLRDLDEPVLLRFAHEPDNPLYPWSRTGENTPEEFIYAWRYVVEYFDKVGASNVGWIFSPWEEDNVEEYFPGDHYVDWISVTALNYGLAARDGTWHDFHEIYEPFRKALVSYRKPVMLAEFGTTPYGGDQSEWFSRAFEAIKESYPEIQALVFFHSDLDKNWATKWRPENDSNTLEWGFLSSSSTTALIRDELRTEPFSRRPLLTNTLNRTPAIYSSPFYQGATPGAFSFLVDNATFTIKGIAYNPGHDWRDGNAVLTRKKLTRDFALIRDTGANTIRRYSVSPYDRNILTIAQEHDLKVMSGFWFEPAIDYMQDTEQLEAYERQVLKTVEAFRDSPSLLAWTLGNEVWGLLKHRYTQPYLTLLRRAYALFIEDLAKKIHALDPHHPVFAVHEHAEELPAAFLDFTRHAPSLDAVGVNSYYEPHIASLNHTASLFNPSRPYFVSEFGPDGYWDDVLTYKNSNDDLVESSSLEKASTLLRRWRTYIQKNAGYTVGSILYTWQDRYEGTLSWFGLTDLEGRLKPAYHWLREAWTGASSTASFPVIQKIHSPAGVFLPDTEVIFTASLIYGGSESIQYEWQLFRDNVFPTNEGVLRSDKDRLVLTTPSEAGSYRLYLTIRDGSGNADTLSVPVRVEEFEGLR